MIPSTSRRSKIIPVGLPIGDIDSIKREDMKNKPIVETDTTTTTAAAMDDDDFDDEPEPEPEPEIEHGSLANMLNDGKDEYDDYGYDEDY